MVNRIAFMSTNSMIHSEESNLASPTSEVRIRKATLNDVQAVVDFNTALAWETEGKQLEPLRLKLGVSAVLVDSKRGFYLIAEEVSSGKPLGQLLLTYEWSDWRNGVFWWIQSVYVHEGWRRRGVFRRLFQSLMEQMKEQQAVVGVRLYVEEGNRLAQQVYKKMGLCSAGYQVYELDMVLPRQS
jgi:ribosomal protein S18 acetylase RimI-like enzyme